MTVISRITKDQIAQRARVQLLSKYPFVASIVLSTDIIEADELRDGTPIPTACTDGDRIWYNPAWIESLAPGNYIEQADFLAAVLAHEGWHIALLHPFRMQDRIHKLWNIACDIPINDMVEEDGLQLPKDCIREPKYKGKSAEEIYADLFKNAKKIIIKGTGIGDVIPHPSTTGNGDEKDNGNGGTYKESASDAEARIKVKVQKAADIAKAMGNLPASIARQIEKVLDGTVNWKEELWATMNQIKGNDDYSWNKVNRRVVWQKRYQPSMIGTTVGPIALIIDTSGSIGSAELEAALGELNSIFEQVCPEKIYLGFCDADMPELHTLEMMDLPMSPEEFSKRCTGGGGTSFVPPFKRLHEEGIEPVCLIYITDMYGDFPSNAPNYPVIWLSTSRVEDAPFGKVINIEV